LAFCAWTVTGAAATRLTTASAAMNFIMFSFPPTPRLELAKLLLVQP
jgi:hypothetical protein